MGIGMNSELDEQKRTVRHAYQLLDSSYRAVKDAESRYFELLNRMGLLGCQRRSVARGAEGHLICGGVAPKYVEIYGLVFKVCGHALCYDCNKKWIDRQPDLHDLEGIPRNVRDE